MDLDRPITPDPYDRLLAVPAFEVTSDDVVDGAPLPAAATADGDDRSPRDAWRAGAGSADGTALSAPAFQTRNDAGTTGYTGAAPPPGDRAHRYASAVHALDVESVDPGPGTTPTTVAALFHTIARATITPTSQR